MAYTAPRTYTTGEIVTATILNTDLRDNLRWLGGVTGIGTSLPVSPVEGEVFILTDSLTAPTYTWHLRYFGARATNKWLVFSTSPLFSYSASIAGTSSSGYTDMGGPTLTVPIVGDYFVTVSAGFQNTGTSTNMMSYTVGGTAASDDWCVAGRDNEGGSNRTYWAALAATTALAVRIRNSNSSGDVASFNRALLELTPYALGG